MCEALAKQAGDTSDVLTIDQRLFELEQKTYDHEVASLALEEVNEQEEIIAAFVSDLTRVPSVPVDSCLARDSSSTLTCTRHIRTPSCEPVFSIACPTRCCSNRFDARDFGICERYYREPGRDYE